MLFLVLMPKQKKIWDNKIVMMVFLGKFFLTMNIFSTPGIDSCAYFLKLKQHFHFFYSPGNLVLFTECLTTVIFFIISTQGGCPHGGNRV